jgi:hypothetical protein
VIIGSEDRDEAENARMLDGDEEQNEEYDDEDVSDGPID